MPASLFIKVYSDNGLVAKFNKKEVITALNSRSTSIPLALTKLVSTANRKAKGRLQKYRVVVEVGDKVLGETEGVHMWRRRKYTKALGMEVEGATPDDKAWVVDGLDGYITIFSSTDFLLLPREALFCSDTILPCMGLSKALGQYIEQNEVILRADFESYRQACLRHQHVAETDILAFPR